MTNKIVYFDMDGTLVNFQSGIDKLTALPEHAGRKVDWDDVPEIFPLMDPVDGAIEAAKLIATMYDVYILSKSPWKNPNAPSDKHVWIKQHFGDDKNSIFYKRVILSGHKHLNRGDFLIDDRRDPRFEGIQIHFGCPMWPDWQTVTKALSDHFESGATIAQCECPPSPHL
jgi:5'(3')-deoxyribonucleotidase